MSIDAFEVAAVPFSFGMFFCPAKTLLPVNDDATGASLMGMILVAARINLHKSQNTSNKMRNQMEPNFGMNSIQQHIHKSQGCMLTSTCSDIGGAGRTNSVKVQSLGGKTMKGRELEVFRIFRFQQGVIESQQVKPKPLS